jgi:hypothetical protein
MSETDSDEKLIAPKFPEVSDSFGLEHGQSENRERELASILRSGINYLGGAGQTAIDATRSGLATALASGIRMISAERDRDEVIRWFVNARAILAQGESASDTAKALYQSTDTLRFAQLLANTISTSVANYGGSKLPLSLKVAMPVTAIGAACFGTQYAGLAAMGGGIGLPVVLLLLFLGTAGVTSVIEGFVKDRSVRDPLTRLNREFDSPEPTGFSR